MHPTSHSRSHQCAAHLFCILLAILSAVPSFSAPTKPTQRQRYASFEASLKSDDLKAAEQKLKEWQAASPTDVELAVAWGNFYAQQGSLPIQIYSGPLNNRNVEPGAGGAYEIQKPGTSETIGYIDARPRHTDDSLLLAEQKLEDAITTYRQRADIWMGITHVQLLRQDHDAAFSTLQHFGEFAKSHPDKLLWRFDEPVKVKSAKFLPEKLHDYAVRGYDEDTTAGREFMLKVAKLAQQLYPENVVAYNDEAVYYNHLEDDNHVLECLLRAHEVDPKDALVVMNIGAAYKNLKQADKAREYYTMVTKMSADKELKDSARKELKGLAAEHKSTK